MSVTSRVARRGIKPCPIETSGRLNWVTAKERERVREKKRERERAGRKTLSVSG